MAAADPGDEAPTAPDLRPGRERAGLGFQDPSTALHPYLGYVFLPKEKRGGEGRPGIAVSPDGVLDPGPLVRKRSADRYIVGLTGGSVSGQMGTFHGAHLERALRDLPGTAGRTLEFVWLGMPGYHQPQQLFQVGWLLARGGELDLLVNLDGFNELAVPCALNAPQGAHPLFPMNWSMVALDTPDPDLRRDLGAIAFLKEERAARTAEFAASAWSWSPTARLLWKREDDRLAARIAAHAWSLQNRDAEEIPWFVRGPADAHVPLDAMILECVEVWRRSSLQLQALCDANGIRYLHCLQPNQYDPDSKPLSGTERTDAIDAESPYREPIEKGYPLLRDAGRQLREAGVDFHDLSLAFADARATLYVDNCCHFNGEGNRILADAIGAALR
jgi:hypothetical protein